MTAQNPSLHAPRQSAGYSRGAEVDPEEAQKNGYVYRARWAPIHERLWGRTELNEHGCWLWLGYQDEDGYGNISYREKSFRCHRLSWTLARGPIPESLQVLHDCDRFYAPGDRTYRRCCNPAHLKLGTNSDNMADMAAKNRAATGLRNARYTHPETSPRGDRHGMRIHPGILAGERNAAAKLTSADVVEIRKANAQGIEQKELAFLFGVSGPAISKIVLRRTWRHVP